MFGANEVSSLYVSRSVLSQKWRKSAALLLITNSAIAHEPSLARSLDGVTLPADVIWRRLGVSMCWETHSRWSSEEKVDGVLRGQNLSGHVQRRHIDFGNYYKFQLSV